MPTGTPKHFTLTNCPKAHVSDSFLMDQLLFEEEPGHPLSLPDFFFSGLGLGLRIFIVAGKTEGWKLRTLTGFA